MNSNRFIAIGDRHPDRRDWLKSCCDTDVFPRHLAIVYLTEPVLHSDNFPWEVKRGADPITRIVLVWDQLPIAVDMLADYKERLATDKDHAVVFCPSDCQSLEQFKEWVAMKLTRWTPPQTRIDPDVHVAMTCGQYVNMPHNAKPDAISTAFVSMSFGPMQDLLERLEFWKQQYYQQVAGITSSVREGFHNHLRPFLKRTENNTAQKTKDPHPALVKFLDEYKITDIHPGTLPVILLTGETGTGKTLVARYLAQISQGNTHPFERVSLPEFESAEQHFEYEMFGYKGGTFSDSDPDGNPGILLNRIGGVVFLDEIGDATPPLQRKLLAFLDDYIVRPRGCTALSLFCPIMIVAATNHDLEEDIKNKTFRKDLYERFDVHIPVPSLNVRKDDFKFILDTVLQNPGINPRRQVTTISQSAYDFLLDFDYTNGNFRKLENLLRSAIREAGRHDRTQLTAHDFTKQNV